MKKLITGKVILVALIAAVVLVAGGLTLLGNNKKDRAGGVPEKITVFHSPTCGCCGNYVAYLKHSGYEVEAIRQADLSGIKTEYGIPSSLESCHTSIVGNYVIEGHVPIEAVQKLLAEKPDIAGIALAGMPSGSPGMAGAKLAPFQIHAITVEGEDGGIFTEF